MHIRAAADKAAKSYAELAAGGAGNGYKKLAALFDAEYLSVTDKAKLANIMMRICRPVRLSLLLKRTMSL